MILKYGLIAEEITSDEARRRTIKTTFNEIQAAEFPCVHPLLYLAIGIEAHAHEEGQHQMEVCFVDADYKPMGKPLLQELEVGPGIRYLDIALAVRGLEVKEPGHYEFAVRVDETHLGSIALAASLTTQQ